MATTIKPNELRPNATILVKGKTRFSRISKKIEGEELERENQRRSQRGIQPADKPYTTITVEDAQIYKPENPLSKEQAYIQERFYNNNTTNKLCYSPQNKGKDLPYIGLKQDNGEYKQIKLENELASGLDVILVLRVIPTKPNQGITLDGVLIDSQLSYYNPNDVESELQKAGITFKREAVTPTIVDEPVPQEATEPVQQATEQPLPSDLPQEVNPQEPQAQTAAPAPTPATTPDYNPNADVNRNY